MTVDDLNAYREKLIKAMAGGIAVVESPALGRVEFSSPSEIEGAISWVDQEILRLQPQQRTFVAQSNRGTGGCL
jgi:hypothetical protein